MNDIEILIFIYTMVVKRHRRNHSKVSLEVHLFLFKMQICYLMTKLYQAQISLTAISACNYVIMNSNNDENVKRSLNFFS